MGIVTQDTILFNDTVKANVAYGLENSVSEHQIIEAARAAGAKCLAVTNSFTASELVKAERNKLVEQREAFEQEAKHGDRWAQLRLGLLYERGEGGTKDLKKAAFGPVPSRRLGRSGNDK